MSARKASKMLSEKIYQNLKNKKFIMDFLYRVDSLKRPYFIVYQTGKQNVVAEDYDPESVLLQLAILGIDFQDVNFYKVQNIEEVQTALKKSDFTWNFIK